MRQIQSLVDYVLYQTTVFGYNDMRINYFRRALGFVLLSMRGMTLYNLLLPLSSSFFALQVICGSLVSDAASFSSWKARNSMNSLPISKILVFEIISKS